MGVLGHWVPFLIETGSSAHFLFQHILVNKSAQLSSAGICSNEKTTFCQVQNVKSSTSTHVRRRVKIVKEREQVPHQATQFSARQLKVDPRSYLLGGVSCDD